MSEGPAAKAEASTFSPMTVLWMVLAGVFSFSAFVVLSAFAPDLRGGADGGAHALSHSAVGFAGLVDLLRDENQAVLISRNSSDARDPNWSLLVLTPGAAVADKALQHFVQSGPTLVVLPKWEVGPDPNIPGWVSKAGLIDAKALQKTLAQNDLALTLARRGDAAQIRLAPASQPGGGQPAGRIDQLQTVQFGPAFEPLLVDDHGQAVLIARRDRAVAILADPDLLNTHGLKDPSTALAGQRMINLLRAGDGPIAFDVSLDGFDSPPSLLKLAFQPPFLGVTLCLAAAAGLMGLHAANRFGPPTQTGRAIAFGKRALADNSAALIRLARREPKMAPRYLELTRAAVAKALGVTRLSGDALDAHLDHAAKAAGVTPALAEIAPELGAVKTRADLLKVAGALYHWRVEMTREHR